MGAIGSIGPRARSGSAPWSAETRPTARPQPAEQPHQQGKGERDLEAETAALVLLVALRGPALGILVRDAVVVRQNGGEIEAGLQAQLQRLEELLS